MVDLQTEWRDAVKRFGVMRSLLLYGSLVATMPFAFIPITAVRVPLFLGAVALWLNVVPKLVTRKARRDLRRRLTLPDVPPGGIYERADGLIALSLRGSRAIKQGEPFAVASITVATGELGAVVEAISVAVVNATFVNGSPDEDMIVGAPVESRSSFEKALVSASGQLGEPGRLGIAVTETAQTVQALIATARTDRTQPPIA